MSTLDALRYALRGLTRGGQRGALALGCIAFGVLSLVGLLLLSSMVKSALQVDARTRLGGELVLEYGDGRLDAARVAELEQLREEGVLSAYTLFAATPLAMVRPEGTGRVYFLSRATGVEHTTYPLFGEVVLEAPAGATLSQVLERPGSAVITRDLARSLGVGPGATLRLGGRSGSAVALTVAGIAERVPDRRGDSMLFSLETARQVLGTPDVASYAAAIPAPERDAEARLRASGWRLTRAGDKKPDSAEIIFATMLSGAGLLGLLIGGLGVANTLQVTLARRTPEIAALKTLGYRQRDLLLLFGIETALLGLVGSLIGTVASTLLARLLMGLLDSLQGTVLLEFTIDPRVIASGIAAGVSTAVIFGLFAIVRASAVRPSVLLRELPTSPTRQTRLAAAGLALLLAALFGAVATLIMGSLPRGAAVIALAAAGLAVLGGAMAALLALVLRLPAPGLPALVLALRNLRHRQVRSVFALVALFAGVFSIGYAGAAMLSGAERVAARRGTDEGVNLTLYTSPAGEARAVAAARAEGVEELSVIHTLDARLVRSDGSPLRFASGLEGRADEYATLGVRLLDGAVWSPAPDAAYLPDLRHVHVPRVGERLVARLPGHADSVVLRVAGFYERSEMMAGGAFPVLVHRAALAGVGGEVGVRVVMAVPPARLAAVAETLGGALPDAMLVSKSDFNDLLARPYRGLFMFVATIAGLAFVAGAVLIANAVGLAMLERRREIGIFKALGYARGHVLASALLENALLGVLAGVSGMAAVAGAVALTNLRFADANMRLPPAHALAMIAISVALALASAALVAWRPTSVRPLEVLRAE